MISSIQIKNYALIEDAYIDLHQGLNVITGETGAGKSLFLSAISLILGEKADLKLIKNKEKETSVLIEINPKSLPQLKKFLKENDLDSDIFILKRKFSQDNSRCFINEQPVSLNKVRELMANLVYICSQNENTQISDSSEQRKIVDSFDMNPFLEELHKLWTERKKIISQIDELNSNSKNVEFNSDFVTFQLNDIRALSLSEKDLALSEKLSEMEKETQLFEVYKEMSESLIHNENSLPQQLKLLIHYCEKLNKYGKKIDISPIEKMRSELSELLGKIDVESFDQSEVENLKNRVETLKPILKKHGPTIKDVLDKQKSLENQLKKIENFEAEILNLTSQVESLTKKALSISIKISKHRLKVIPEIEKKISSQLQDLNMKGASFHINLTPNQELSAHGTDKIEFLIKPHAGQNPMPLAKIASGGEISRIVLALNSVINTSGFFLFDEIDSGIGGNTGLSIGQKLKSMSKKNQIICITHLHQVAVYSDRHFKIEKKQEKNKTTTQILELNEENQVKEISRMLGDDLSSKTLDHAKELLKNAQKK